MRAAPPPWPQTPDARSCGLPTRRNAHAGAHAPSVHIEPGAPGLQGFRPSPSDRKGAGMKSPGTESTRRAHRASGLAIRALAGLRAKLEYGLSGAKEEPTSVPASHATQYPRPSMVGSGSAGWRTWLTLPALPAGISILLSNLRLRTRALPAVACKTYTYVDRAAEGAWAGRDSREPSAPAVRMNA